MQSVQYLSYQILDYLIIHLYENQRVYWTKHFKLNFSLKKKELLPSGFDLANQVKKKITQKILNNYIKRNTKPCMYIKERIQIQQ